MTLSNCDSGEPDMTTAGGCRRSACCIPVTRVAGFSFWNGIRTKCQPTASAASWTPSPTSVDDEVSALRYAIVSPLGAGLVSGPVTVMDVGTCSYLATLTAA